MSVSVGLLGPVELHKDGAPVAIRGTKQRALLAALALSVNQVVATDTLMVALWGEELEGASAHSLQQQVSTVRKLLADGGAPTAMTLEHRAPGYVLRAAGDVVDVVVRVFAVR